MRPPNRGEVWLVDLGLAAKIRPALVLNVLPGEKERSLTTMVPHTTSLRGSHYEVPVKVAFLRAGAFDTQGLVTVPTARLVRRLGSLSPEQMKAVESGVRAWLGL